MTSRYHAVKILLESGLNSLPITIEQIEKIINSKGFSIINYDINYSDHIEILEDMGVLSLAKRVKAFTYTSKNEQIVFIRSGISTNDKRLLLAHELGHIVMGHMSANAVVGYKPGGLIDEGQEDEANAFALEFLAPICVLAKKHIRTVQDVKTETLLDDKLSYAVVDEVKKHKKFTNYELELCERFEVYKKPAKETYVKFKHYISMCVTTIIVLSVLIYISVSVLNMGKTKSSIKDFSDPTTEIQQTVQPTAIPNVSRDTIVAVTRTGTRYHRPDCKHVQDRGSVVYMTMEEAINAEYEPCTDCRPDNN